MKNLRKRTPVTERVIMIMSDMSSSVSAIGVCLANCYSVAMVISISTISVAVRSGLEIMFIIAQKRPDQWFYPNT